MSEALLGRPSGMENTENLLIFSKGKNSTQEFVLPHKLAILSLLKAYCTVKQRARSTTDIIPDEWIHSNEEHRNFAIALFKLIQGPTIDLKDLNHLIKPILLPKAYELFLENLKELEEGGVATLMDFIQGLDMLMIDPHFPIPLVHKSSITGLYLRKIMLAFDKLSFSQVSHLYKQYKMYYKKSGIKDVAVIEENSADTQTFRGRNELIERYWKLSNTQVTSRKQAELFIGQQAALLQTNEVEALPPKKLQDKIVHLFQNKLDLAEAQYLSFLNAVRVQEVLGATHSLYHCFDRAVLQVPPDSKNNIATSGDSNSRGARYAALNLASLHAHFNHKEEALSALKEAITLAHEANDNVCLQHAMVSAISSTTFFFHIPRAVQSLYISIILAISKNPEAPLGIPPSNPTMEENHPISAPMWLTRLDPENVELLLERCIIKTGEIGLPVIGALGWQALAQSKALLSSEPTLIFESMIKSDMLICQHSMLDLMTNSYCQKAALWKMYGKTTMSLLMSQMLLNLNTSDAACSGLYHNDEGICKVLTSTAMECFNRGEYETSNAILAHAESMFPEHRKNSSTWISCRYLTMYIRQAYDGKWDAAEESAKCLAVVDFDESQYRNIELLFLTGQVLKSSTLIDKLLANNKDFSHHYHARLMLLKVELLCEAHNTSQALTILFECLSLCQTNFLTYLEALCKLYIANIQIQLNLLSQAKAILNQAVLTILSDGSLYDQAIVYYISAKCIMSKFFHMNDLEKKQGLLKAVEFMERAATQFKSIEASLRHKDCLYWLSLLYNEIGYKNERNRCAREFRLLDSQGNNRTGMHTGLL